MWKIRLFVRVVTHYGSNESNDSLGVFSVWPRSGVRSRTRANLYFWYAFKTFILLSTKRAENMKHKIESGKSDRKRSVFMERNRQVITTLSLPCYYTEIWTTIIMLFFPDPAILVTWPCVGESHLWLKVRYVKPSKFDMIHMITTRCFGIL